MVDDHGEPGSRGVALEGLGQGWPVPGIDERRVDARIEDRVVADRGDRRRLVDQRELDGVRADRACVDVGVLVAVGHRVERGHEVGDRLMIVVLDLHESDDVGIEADQGADDLGALAIELEGRVGTAAFQVLPGAADVGAIAAARVGVERREVVEHVHRRDREVAIDRCRRRRAGVVRHKGDRADRLDAVDVEREVEDAGQRTVDGVADAQGVGGRQAALRVAGRVDVLEAVAVIEEDPAPVVQVLERDRRVTRGDDVRRCVEPATDGQRDLAEAAEAEGLGDGEFLLDRHEHALEGFPVVDRRDWQRRFAGRGHRSRAADDDQRDGAELRQVVEFGDRPADADVVAGGDVDAEEIIEDEDALRCRGVRVDVGVLVLDEEAPRSLVGLVVADHDAFDRDTLADQRAREPGALDVVDGRDRVAAGLDIDRGEGEGVVAGHVVRRIVGVLIGDRGAGHGDLARLRLGEVEVRVERECRWAATDRGGVDTGALAIDREPRVRDVDRLTEGDRHVGLEGDTEGPVPRHGLGHCRREVDARARVGAAGRGAAQEEVGVVDVESVRPDSG